MRFESSRAGVIAVAGLGWRRAVGLLGDCAYLAVPLALAAVWLWSRSASLRHRSGVLFLVLLTLVQFVVAAGIVHLQIPHALLGGGLVGAGLAKGLLRVLGTLPSGIWIPLVLGGGRTLWQLVIQARRVR